MNSSTQGKYDSSFLHVIQGEGQVQKFLDEVFSFLYRRTDFYQPRALNDEKTMGFPEGVAERLVSCAFKKYQNKFQEEKIKADINAAVRDEMPKNKPPSKTPQSANNTIASQSNDSNIMQPPKGAELQTPETPKLITKCNSSPEPAAKKHKLEETSVAVDKKSKADKDDDSELKRLQTIYQANPDSYNGAIRDKYSWSQEMYDVDVRVRLPDYVTSANQCYVTITKKHLKVSVKDPSGGKFENIVDGELLYEVKCDASMWSLCNAIPKAGEYRHVYINLEKIEELWWDALLVGEQKISLNNISCVKSMDDVDEESKGKLQEMVFNERQKKLGLPQSHQIKMEPKLRKMWDAEASPFKGQPFDLSKINISGNGFGQ